MKRILYMLAFVWMGIGMISCEKDLMDYEGEEGVYFYVQWGEILPCGRISHIPRLNL